MKLPRNIHYIIYGFIIFEVFAIVEKLANLLARYDPATMSQQEIASVALVGTSIAIVTVVFLVLHVGIGVAHYLGMKWNEYVAEKEEVD